uniref:RING-type domain-containing protein n=1 Tax=Parascaris univalens TaxID=6257 RepID=A0A915A628_PARUN
VVMSTEDTALDGMEQEGHKKDITEGVLLEERPARLLVRGTPRDSTFSSRLSTVIRRSLRLGPKRSTTASDLGSLARVGKSLSDQETDIHGRGTKCFTEYAEIKIEHYPKPYGTLAELKRLLQLARRTSIKRFVRHNNWPIGHEVRTDLWKELCRDRDFDANKQLYSHEVQVMLQNGGIHLFVRRL